MYIKTLLNILKIFLGVWAFSFNVIILAKHQNANSLSLTHDDEEVEVPDGKAVVRANDRVVEGAEWANGGQPMMVVALGWRGEGD